MRKKPLVDKISEAPSKVMRRKKLITESHLKQIQPLTKNQEKVFEYYSRGYNLVLEGTVGTGKSFCAIYLAIKDILNPQTNYNKLIIARSALATRDIGFLPGTLEEKIEVYELPYRSLIKSMFSFENEFLDNVYDKLKEQNSLEFISTSYIRGITLDNCILLVDEFQSLNFHELNSIITRVGLNSKIIFSGDPIHQSDLQKESEKRDAVKFLKILNIMTEFKTVQFCVDDIVRSNLVKSFIIAKEKLGF